MPTITSKIDRSSEDFEKNTASHTKLVDELNEVNDYVMQGGSERSREKHLARGKLLARDRIRLLLDPDADFLELGRHAGWRVYSDDVPCAGIVTGIGRIHECNTKSFVLANRYEIIVDQRRNDLVDLPHDRPSPREVHDVTGVICGVEERVLSRVDLAGDLLADLL